MSQRAFPKFDAAEGSKAIRNALDVAAGPPLVLQTAPRTARPPAPAQRIVDEERDEERGLRSSPILVAKETQRAGAAPVGATPALIQFIGSATTILQHEVETFCRLVLSSQRGTAEHFPSMQGLVDAVELSMKCRLVDDEESLADYADTPDLTADVLEHHSAVYSVLFSLLKSGDYVADRKKLQQTKRSGTSPTSPPPPPSQVFGATRTFRPAASEISIVDESSPSDCLPSPAPACIPVINDHQSSNITAAVHVPRSLLSHYFLRPIGAVVCLAAQRLAIPHDQDGWGVFGRPLHVPAALMFQQQRGATTHEDPLSLPRDSREQSPPIASCRESQSTSRCTSPSQFRNTTSHLAHSGSGQMSLTFGGAADFHSDDVVPEDELFVRLHQWAVAAHRRRRRLSRSETMDESSLEDVDALVGLAGKGYRCKEPTNEERDERLSRGIAKAKLSGVIDSGDGRNRSGSAKSKPQHRHGLGQVDALSGSGEQELCLRYPSQAQQHLLFSPSSESTKGSPSRTAAAAAATAPEAVVPLLQRQNTTDSCAIEGVDHNDMSSCAVEDVHMTVFLPEEALDEQKSLTSSPHKNHQYLHANLVGSVGQTISALHRTKLDKEAGSELPSASGGTAYLPSSQMSMSIHGNTSSSAEDRLEAVACLEAHQFSRTAGYGDSSYSIEVEGGSTSRNHHHHHMLRSEPQQLALIGLGAQRGVLMHSCCSAISAAASAFCADGGAGEAILSACFQRAKAAIPTTILPTSAHLALPDHLDAPQSPRAPVGTAEAICALPPIGFDVVAPLCGSLPSTYARLLLLPCITPALEHSDIPAGLRMLLTYTGLLCLPLRHPSSSQHSSRKGTSPHQPSAGGSSSLHQSDSRARWLKNSSSSNANQQQLAVVSASSSAVGSGVPEHVSPQRPSGTHQQTAGGGFSRSSLGSSGTATSASWPSPAVDSAMHWHRDEELLFWLVVQWRTNSEPEPIQ